MFPSLFTYLDVNSFHCETCKLAKYRVSFPLRNKKSSTSFALIRTNVWRPSWIQNISRAQWFVFFIDDCSRATWLFLLKDKYDVSSVFPIFQKMINNQFGVQIEQLKQRLSKEWNLKYFLGIEVSHFLEMTFLCYNRSTLLISLKKWGCSDAS